MIIVLRSLFVIILVTTFICNKSFAQSGNHQFSGSESVNYGTINLTTPGGQTWSTARTATPGYFGAVKSAVYTGAADNANVNGYVKYYALSAPSASFVFPVGTGTDLRTLTISGTIPATGQYGAAWILGDPSGSLDPTAPNAGAHSVSNFESSLAAISSIGQWDWQDLSSDAAGLTITASIPDMTGFASAADLRLVGWNGSQWVNLSGSTGASNNTENSTLAGIMVANITAIGIGAVSAPLPVKLISFDAIVKNCDIQFSWIVANESDFSHYELEYSVDGKSFNAFKFITAESKSMYQIEYTPQSANKKGYYRLKMVDLNGTVNYSKIISIYTHCNDYSVIIYPSLTNNSIFIDGASVGSQVYIFNVLGQEVLSQKVDIRAVQMINISSFTNGVYSVIVTDGETKQIAKIIKVN